jgi:2-amino-4-hydroxy-6-hydroxymethyldihydropteridine diphosphokinase
MFKREATIGIGTNVGDKALNILIALKRLSDVGDLKLWSSIYLTKPWGFTDQPDFFNAAAVIETDLEAHALLRVLKQIELSMGRVETHTWGPRLIDLDILLIEGETFSSAELTVPHSGMMERTFVLAPLSEIDLRFLDAFSQLPASSREEVTLLRSIDASEFACFPSVNLLVQEPTRGAPA